MTESNRAGEEDYREAALRTLAGLLEILHPHLKSRKPEVKIQAASAYAEIVAAMIAIKGSASEEAFIVEEDGGNPLARRLRLDR